MPSIFATGINLVRDSQGAWIVSRLKTNQGTFSIGDNENHRLRKEILQDFGNYIVEELKKDILEVLEEERLQKEKTDEHQDSSSDNNTAGSQEPTA